VEGIHPNILQEDDTPHHEDIVVILGDVVGLEFDEASHVVNTENFNETKPFEHVDGKDMECAIYSPTYYDDVATLAGLNSNPKTRKDNIVNPIVLKFEEKLEGGSNNKVSAEDDASDQEKQSHASIMEANQRDIMD